MPADDCDNARSKTELPNLRHADLHDANLRKAKLEDMRDDQ